MIKRSKFKDRYVLASGYPWGIGLGVHTDIRMVAKQTGVKPIRLKYPVELWDVKVPRYRLVLERVKP